jgi:hypothetical protein
MLLRSMFPVVLGLGGWLLSALIVMTSLPSIPIYDQLVVVNAMSLPVGLGIYWACVDGERSAQAKTVGSLTALGRGHHWCMDGFQPRSRISGAGHHDHRCPFRHKPDANPPQHFAGLVSS